MAKILIVDDSPIISEIHKGVLEAEGYEVDLALDGAEGLAKAGEIIPDLIILDVILPKLNGYDVCRALKKDERLKNIPVVMLTAKATEADRKIGMEAGADDFIVISSDLDDFLATAQKYLMK